MDMNNLPYFAALFTRVGEELLAKKRPEKLPVNREELFAHFHKANDQAIALIKPALAREFPQIAWSDTEPNLGKADSTPISGDHWLCDPIDGAVHYLQGFPGWAISLCLIREQQPVFSLVYDPYRKELFAAFAGKGAFVNGQPIRVSEKREWPSAFVATAHPSIPAEELEETSFLCGSIARIMPQVAALRMLGSVSLQLAYVAAGRLDGFWEHGYDPHDLMAGALLVQEAGGTVTDSSGQRLTLHGRGIIAANPFLHASLQAGILTESR
ncbi:inositol monophosphatase family protein [Brevibacillus migulae]|uniref:inositol monophosphatase family protein n=1 Tax=Brevibacillus migulae TaxID=1644114 RepID=UPI001431C153|nr:inositol monophosphatase family protein [Brevibacillus migulae]